MASACIWGIKSAISLNKTTFCIHYLSKNEIGLRPNSLYSGKDSKSGIARGYTAFDIIRNDQAKEPIGSHGSSSIGSLS